jgi:PAS domain S-box-containing protein
MATQALPVHHKEILLVDPTLQPSLEEHLSRLAKSAEELHSKLMAQRDSIHRAGATLPRDLLDGLRQISGTLYVLKKSVEGSGQELRNLQSLAEIGQVINSSLDLKTVLNEVIDRIIQLTGAERAFLMLRNEVGEMQVVTARNWGRESLEPGEVEVSRTIVSQVLTKGEAVLATNAQADPRFGRQESVVAYNLRSILCVPLKVKDELTGVIYADNKIREGLFTEKERSLLSSFANQAAVALENARLFESVQRTLLEVTELKNLMEDVFASIASGVITADVDEIITLCNRAAELILALPKERVLGQSLGSLLPELTEELSEKIEAAKTRDERFIGFEIQPTLDQRGALSLSLNITPLKTAGQATRGVAIVLDDLTEKRRLEAQRRLFERMVSPAVIDQLDPDSLQLGGQRTEITTLFADIRGFTSFSEGIDPETLVSVLNRYLAGAAEAILNQEGTIDKFMGDEVMAWFNAPIPQPDHTLRAVRAALGVRSAMYEICKELPEHLHLSFGVGIHAGEALLGLIGTQKRVEYTAIGDSVNTAKRLQENAGPGQILISKETAARVADHLTLKALPPIIAEGKGQPLEAFEIIDLR